MEATLGRILKKLKDSKQEKEANLINGYAQDFSVYRFCVGEIQGLQTSIELIQEFFNEGIENDE